MKHLTKEKDTGPTTFMELPCDEKTSEHKGITIKHTANQCLVNSCVEKQNLEDTCSDIQECGSIVDERETDRILTFFDIEMPNVFNDTKTDSIIPTETHQPIKSVTNRKIRRRSRGLCQKRKYHQIREAISIMDDFAKYVFENGINTKGDESMSLGQRRRLLLEQTSRDQQDDGPINDTISILKPRLPFDLRFRQYPLLIMRVVQITKKTKLRTKYVFDIHVEYPVGSGIIWATPSGASKQAYMDMAFLLEKNIPCQPSKDGPSSDAFQSCEYRSIVMGREKWLDLGRLFTFEVRIGLDPIASDIPLPKMSDYNIPIPLVYAVQRSSISDVTHLINLFPDQKEKILAIEKGPFGESRRIMTKIVR